MMAATAKRRNLVARYPAAIVATGWFVVNGTVARAVIASGNGTDTHAVIASDSAIR
jgi:hypothetical protein